MKPRSARGAISLTAAIGLAVSGGLAATLLSVGGSAHAATAKSDVCKKLAVSATTGMGTVSNCTSDTNDVDNPTQGETNGSGTINVPPGSTTGTVTWNAPFEGGATVHLMNITQCVVGSSGCPTDEAELAANSCPAGQSEINTTATIAPGSDDATAVIKSEVCLNGTTGAVTNEPGSKFKTPEPGPPNS